MTANKGFSLADLNTVAVADKGVEFEFEINGQKTGLWLRIRGSQAQAVLDENNRLSNERREKAAARERAAQAGEAAFEPVEEGQDFNRRMTAIRLAGWRGPNDKEGLTPAEAKRFRGCTDPFTPEAAMAMVTGSPEISVFIIAKSNDQGAFTTGLSQAS